MIFLVFFFLIFYSFTYQAQFLLYFPYSNSYPIYSSDRVRHSSFVVPTKLGTLSGDRTKPLAPVSRVRTASLRRKSAPKSQFIHQEQIMIPLPVSRKAKIKKNIVMILCIFSFKVPLQYKLIAGLLLSTLHLRATII